MGGQRVDLVEHPASVDETDAVHAAACDRGDVRHEFCELDAEAAGGGDLDVMFPVVPPRELRERGMEGAQSGDRAGDDDRVDVGGRLHVGQTGQGLECRRSEETDGDPMDTAEIGEVQQFVRRREVPGPDAAGDVPRRVDPTDAGSGQRHRGAHPDPVLADGEGHADLDAAFRQRPLRRADDSGNRRCQKDLADTLRHIGAAMHRQQAVTERIGDGTAMGRPDVDHDVARQRRQG